MTRCVSWGYFPSPWGKLAASWSDRGVTGLAWVSFGEDGEPNGWPCGVSAPSALPGELAHDLSAYFAGQIVDWNRHPLDLKGISSFTVEVLEATRAVPRGGLCTYGELARRVKRPRGARAVGQALGRNPVLLLVPCHRIIGSNGSLGGFTGGLEKKALLLSWEGHVVDKERRRVCPAQHRLV